MTENNDKSSNFSSIEDELELELKNSMQHKNPRLKREPFVSIAEVAAKLPRQPKNQQPDFIDMLGEPELPATPPPPPQKKPQTPSPNVETYNFYDEYVEEIDDIVGPPKPPPPPVLTQTRQWDSAAALQELLEQHDRTSEKLARKAREAVMKERMKELTGEDFSQLGDEANMHGLDTNSLRPDMPGLGRPNSRYFSAMPRKWYDFSLLAKVNIAVLGLIFLGGLYYLHSFHPFAPEIIYSDETPYKTRAKIEDLAPKPQLDAASLLQKHPALAPQPQNQPMPMPIPASAIAPPATTAQPQIPPALLQGDTKPEPVVAIVPPAPSAEPKPVPTPEPVSAPEPAPAPKPEPSPAPVKAVAVPPAPTPVKAPTPKPVPAAKAVKAPAPKPAPVKAVKPEAKHKPAPKIAAKPAPKPAAQAAHNKHGYMAYYVQLASTPSDSAAQNLLRKQSAHLQPVLKNYALNIEKTIIPSKGVYYRLRINVKDAEEAKKLCLSIRQHGGQCIFGIR